jgi:tRNA(Ile)-lysidine synthase
MTGRDDPLPSDAAVPISDDEFTGAMARFAPFERQPNLALAVSGGADSMALAALGGVWARARGGEARAFIVDHGLRAESGEEARIVAGRCRDLGLDAEILVWRGPKPVRGIQAAARRARYDLLGEACARAGLLHLLVAHHADDQAETVALRAKRGSGARGLAGMPAVAEWRDLRLLRPLLAAGKDRLVATARARGLAWVEDPSNLDPAFARGRLRRAGGKLPSTDTIRAHQHRRVAMEARMAADLANCVTIHSAGFAVLDHISWRKLASEQRSEVVSRLAATIGGLAYSPRKERLARFLDRLGEAGGPRSVTFGRCLWTGQGEKVLVRRESRHLPGEMPLEAGKTARWDGRFLVSASGPGVVVGALGAADWRAMREAGLGGGLPQGTAAVLPAFRDLEGVVAVPHLDWKRADTVGCRFDAGFAPYHPLAAAGFAASREADPTAGEDAY